MEKDYSHIVPEGILSVRLSNYAIAVFPGLSTRSGLKKAIKRGEISVNGNAAPTATFISSGDCIEWQKPEYVPLKIYPLKLDVVYEDDYLAVVNKPAGIVVSGNRFSTLENSLRAHLQMSECSDALNIPRAVHRLDSATSGLVIIAKTERVRVALGQMFVQREVLRTYRAVVIGETPHAGVFNSPVEGKEAITRFERINCTPSLVSKHLSELNLFPETGRTHQIRIHLSGAGFPILGDKLYGNPAFLLKGKGLFLSAIAVSFTHPVTSREVNIKIKEPLKFKRFVQGEFRRWQKYSPDDSRSPGEQNQII